MPTSLWGWPKKGEVWEITFTLPENPNSHVTRFVVLERGKGRHWTLRVYLPDHSVKLWKHTWQYWLLGDMKYIGKLDPENEKKLGILCLLLSGWLGTRGIMPATKDVPGTSDTKKNTLKEKTDGPL